jgi:hypothetical protein
MGEEEETKPLLQASSPKRRILIIAVVALCIVAVAVAIALSVTLTRPAVANVIVPASTARSLSNNGKRSAFAKSAVMSKFDLEPFIEALREGKKKGGKSKKKFTFQLDEETSVTIPTHRIRKDKNGVIRWLGKFGSQKKGVTAYNLAIVDDAISGSFKIGNDLWMVSGTLDDVLIEKVSVRDLPTEKIVDADHGASVPSGDALNPALSTAQMADADGLADTSKADVLRILLIFDAKGDRCAAKDLAMAGAIEDHFLDVTWGKMGRTNYDFAFGCVEMAATKVTFNHGGKFRPGKSSDLLVTLKNDKRVNALRDKFSADLVAGIFDLSDHCGMAYRPGFQSVTDKSCIFGYYSLGIFYLFF